MRRCNGDFEQRTLERKNGKPLRSLVLSWFSRVLLRFICNESSQSVSTMKEKLKDIPDTLWRQIYRGNFLTNRTSGYFCFILKMGIVSIANQKRDVKEGSYRIFLTSAGTAIFFDTPPLQMVGTGASLIYTRSDIAVRWAEMVRESEDELLRKKKWMNRFERQTPLKGTGTRGVLFMGTAGRNKISTKLRFKRRNTYQY